MEVRTLKMMCKLVTMTIITSRAILFKLRMSVMMKDDISVHG
jgi:hypothetical protein